MNQMTPMNQGSTDGAVANLSARQLAAFVALAELRSFTRAAAQCHLSQPAFSALIRTLEDSLGARLFDRTTRAVEPTVEGSLFLEPARRLLQDMRLATDDLRDHVARRRGRVALAALPALAAGWLPPHLAAFRRDYPGIELDLADVLSESCVERVRSGRADLALAAVRATAPELSVEPFLSDVFYLVCRRDHPLAKRRKPTLAELAQQPLIGLARHSSVRQALDAALPSQPLRPLLELEQLSSVAGMVLAGLGVTLVPALTLFHFDHPDLVSRPITHAVADEPLQRHIYLIRRRDRALSAAAQAMADSLWRWAADGPKRAGVTVVPPQI
ncbi:LysR family transcriptional regulator [Mitsuaria sp. CC2]|uniref:LysR family transcriptional regulator n=1 Tax=Mitsuaria sp. CC2 TaxID=3029186 RepID=UPI003B8E53BA